MTEVYRAKTLIPAAIPHPLSPTRRARGMLVVVVAATALRARGGELAPLRPMECPHIVSITLARRSELSLGWLDALPNADKLCTALCLRQDLALALAL